MGGSSKPGPVLAPGSKPRFEQGGVAFGGLQGDVGALQECGAGNGGIVFPEIIAFHVFFA